jgi:hypothetical protein
MQNEPNLYDQMNVSAVLTKGYENARLHRHRKNKPNFKTGASGLCYDFAFAQGWIEVLFVEG